MKFVKLSIPLIVLFLSGCAAGLKMPISANQEIHTPTSGKAQIVFMRSTFIGSAISASLYDITSGEPTFLGVIQNNNKIVRSLSPGEHMFMIVGESADFMGANVKTGKTYYAMATPRMGAWKARFSLKPIRRKATGKELSVESNDFRKWQKNTKIVEVDEKASAWAKANMASIKSKQATYWPKWVGKSAADKKERTLQPDDGV